MSPPPGPQPPGLTVGATLTQAAADPWNPAPAVGRATAVLRAVSPIQNQSIMGWGTLNPEPSPGVFDFGSLDLRISGILAAGAEPVITLCGCPDWMKGGAAGTTDWSRIEDAPAAGHFGDFAALAQTVALRYPAVRRFLVWNELKGFWDVERNTWDIAGYTDLYNRVYAAVKQVRSDALVGGPYVVLDSWSCASAASDPSAVRGLWGVLDQRPLDAIDYWLEHATGADLIAVDGGTATRDAGLTVPDFEAATKLRTATEWIRARTQLPVWWAEIYAETSDPGASAADARRAAVMTETLVAVARGGASVALLWQPQASADLASAALFSDTSTAGAAGRCRWPRCSAR